jgi:hypothetical protein
MHLLALAAIALRIVVWPHGPAGPSHSWMLRCDPIGGTLPRAAVACARIDGKPELFAPVPPGSVCTEIYGGPAVARVTGKLGRRKLWATFRRRDGCEIARWEKLAFLFR